MQVSGQYYPDQNQSFHYFLYFSWFGGGRFDFNQTVPLCLAILPVFLSLHSSFGHACTSQGFAVWRCFPCGELRNNLINGSLHINQYQSLHFSTTFILFFFSRTSCILKEQSTVTNQNEHIYTTILTEIETLRLHVEDYSLVQLNTH